MKAVSGSRGMDAHAEAEIRRHAVGDVRPGVAAVVGAVEAPVVLEEEAARAGPRAGRSCGRTGRTRGACRAGTRRARRGCLACQDRAAVVGAVDAARSSSRRSAGPGAFGSTRTVWRQRPAAARHPLRAVGMVPEARRSAPRSSRRRATRRAPRARRRSRARRAPSARPGAICQMFLSDAPAASGKAHERRRRAASRSCRSRRSRRARRPSACSTGAAQMRRRPARAVEGRAVDGAARKERARRLPSGAARSSEREEKEALHRPDEQEHVAVADGQGRRGRLDLLGRHEESTGNGA